MIPIPKSRKAPKMAEYSTPEEVLAAIRDKSKLIAEMQKQADEGKFKSYGSAIGLQRLRMDRAILQGMLPDLKVITDDA